MSLKSKPLIIGCWQYIGWSYQYQHHHHREDCHALEEEWDAEKAVDGGGKYIWDEAWQTLVSCMKPQIISPGYDIPNPPFQQKVSSFEYL